MYDEQLPLVPLDVESAGWLVEYAEQSFQQGHFSIARDAFKRACDVWQALRGPNCVEVARARRGLGSSLLELGEYAAAQTALEQALADCEHLLGPKHRETLRALHDVAITAFYLQRPRQALDLAERVLHLREQTFGGDHPDTIESINSLGMILHQQGQRDRAIALHSDALQRCERSLGGHRRTVETLSGLAARLAHDPATHQRARTLYERALTMSERTLGGAHPTTVRLLNNLAALSAELGDLATARAMLEQSLSLHDQLYGRQHANTASVLVNLGDIEVRALQYDAAHFDFCEALIIYEATLGAHHPDTIRALGELIGVLGELIARGDQLPMEIAIPLHVCWTGLRAAAGVLPSTEKHMPGANLSPEEAAAQLHGLVAQLSAERETPSPAAELQQPQAQSPDHILYIRELIRAGDFATAHQQLDTLLATYGYPESAMHIELVEPLELLVEVMKKRDLQNEILPIQQRIAAILEATLGPTHPHTQFAMLELAERLEHKYGLRVAEGLRGRVADLQESEIGAEDNLIRMARESASQLRHHSNDASADVKPPQPSQAQRRTDSKPNPLADELLYDLKRVPWERLHHAFGPATDVPEQLRMLLSKDTQQRDKAYSELYTNIWHQNTIFQATSYTVPFLLRMLADTRTPDRTNVLYLLNALAYGTVDEEQATQSQQDWLSHTRAAIAQGIDLLFAQLDSSDIDTQQVALSTIAMLPSCGDSSVKRLRSALISTTDMRLRTHIARALHELMDNSEATQRLFAELLTDEQHEAVYLISAVALLQRGQEDAPQVAVQAVLGILRELSSVAHQFDASVEDRAHWEALSERFYPAWGPEPLVFILDGLLHLGPERAQEALLEALGFGHDPEDCEQIAQTLLDCVFDVDLRHAGGISRSYDQRTSTWSISHFGIPLPPPYEAHQLSPTQREALEAILANDIFWQHKSDLLKLYGVPSERNALRQFLA